MTYPPSPRTSRDRGLALRWSALSGIPDAYKVRVPPAGARNLLEGDRQRPASLLEGREGFEAPIDRGLVLRGLVIGLARKHRFALACYGECAPEVGGRF